MIDTGIKEIAVIKEGIYDKEYYYAVYDRHGYYNAGDKVLVSGKNGNILTIDRIIPVEECPRKVTEEIVCKVDMEAYEKRKQLQARKSLIRSKMTSLKHKIVSEIPEDFFANKNYEYATLLAEYRSLCDY